MSTYNIEMNLLNSSSTYDTLYPKVNLSNSQGTLSVFNGGTGVTTLDDLKSNLGISDSALKLETGVFIGQYNTDSLQLGKTYTTNIQLTLDKIFIFSFTASDGASYGGAFPYPDYVVTTVGGTYSHSRPMTKDVGYNQNIFFGYSQNWNQCVSIVNAVDFNGTNDGFVSYTYTNKTLKITSTKTEGKHGWPSCGVIGVNNFTYYYYAIGI